jgi:hypothetical protein
MIMAFPFSPYQLRGYSTSKARLGLWPHGFHRAALGFHPFRSASTAFSPPKAKEFEIAYST